MKYGSIQKSATAGRTVGHTVGPIFEHIFDGMRHYLGQGSANNVFEGFNCG